MKRHLLNASSVVFAASALATVGGAAAFGQEELVVEGNVALVSDYRFRGVSLSDKDIALQGGFDLGTPSGFYVGTWGSSIENLTGSDGEDSELELDLYGGYGFEVENFAFDVGVLGYFYPGAEDLEYYEIYGSVGTTLGIVDTSVGIAFAPDQDNIGNEENTYVYLTGGMPLGDSPFSLSGSIGYEDGAFGDLDGDGDSKVDWSLGLSTTAAGVDIGLSYIDTSEDTDMSDGTVVLSFSKAM